ETWHPVDSSVDGAATTSTAGVHMPARILGEVPVAEDGSVYATVPSNTPFRVQYLDKNRMVVGRQHNRWLYVYPGEHFQQATKRELYTQQCGKCHGAVSGNPSDITTPPDVTTSASTTLARYENRNLLEPKDPVDLGEQTRRTVDFASDVQPILDRRCNGGTCHGSNSPAAGVDLSATPTEHYSTAYEELLAAGEGSGGGNRYVDAASGRARTSHLVEIVRGEEFDAPKSIAGHPSVEVPDDEVLTIVRWIETGAHYEVSETDGR
ncbi:MAG: hypothetical protein ABEL76_11290, partial [Bradymonadaceae bacterium]